MRSRSLATVTVACSAVAALLVVPAVSAQTSPFLPDALHRSLVNELSGDRSFEHVRHLSHFHRTGGSRDFFAAAEYVRSAAEAAGLQDVKLVRQKSTDHSWSALSGEAWLVAPEETKLASYGEIAVSIADMSRTTHLSAELVDVGSGASASDYEKPEVKGRIVLASGALGKVMQEAVWKRGALGILSHRTNRKESFDAPEQVAWGRLPYESKGVEGVEDGKPSTFAVMLSPRRGRWLQKQLQAGQSLKVKVDIEAELPETGEQAYVEGYLRGSEIHDQQIVLTAHIQEEMTSANDDGSGCGNLLEMGRALSSLIQQGKLPRPKRDLRFWWVNEFNSEAQYFRENPEAPKQMLLGLNQDMVGARQSWGGRVQYASRLPWSLPHALDDVMESVLLAVRDGNTELLTMRGRTIPQPFSKEIAAVKGTREPFHARMVPYFGNTDHHALTRARVGVPASTLTNWPDELIHSTGDELDNIDATQLERNAVVISGVALYFANLSEAEAPLLASQVATRARARIAADLATAAAHLSTAAAEDRVAAFRSARNLVIQSYAKELKALASVRRFAGRGRGGELIAFLSQRLESARPADLEVLERTCTALTGSQPPNLELSAEEKAMSQTVYLPVLDYGAFEDATQKAKAPATLHPILRFEVLNFADGRRNALEVYEAVAAEALSAGSWYFGTPTPAEVRETLENATAAGAFTSPAKTGKK